MWAEQEKITTLQRDLAVLRDGNETAKRIRQYEKEVSTAKLEKSIARADVHFDLARKGFEAMVAAVKEMAEVDTKACKIFVTQANEILLKTQAQIGNLEKRLFTNRKIDK